MKLKVRRRHGDENSGSSKRNEKKWRNGMWLSISWQLINMYGWRHVAEKRHQLMKSGAERNICEIYENVS
jgi:hypothetical protein